MRDSITTLLEVAGFVSLVASAATVGLGPALLVAGLSLLAIGYLAGRG